VHLPAAPGVDLPVDGDLTCRDDLAGSGAVVDEAGQLEQLAEANGVVADLDLLGCSAHGGLGYRAAVGPSLTAPPASRLLRREWRGPVADATMSS